MTRTRDPIITKAAVGRGKSNAFQRLCGAGEMVESADPSTTQTQQTAPFRVCLADALWASAVAQSDLLWTHKGAPTRCPRMADGRTPGLHGWSAKAIGRKPRCLCPLLTTLSGHSALRCVPPAVPCWLILVWNSVEPSLRFAVLSFAKPADLACKWPSRYNDTLTGWAAYSAVCQPQCATALERAS